MPKTWIDPDYVDVAERLRLFYERFPDGRLVTETPWIMQADGREFVVCHVRAYRDPEDSLPGDGYAWEPIPGPTPFTRDSELMNAQTSAWGRAIVALGFETKKIASAEEVRNRSALPEGESTRVERTETVVRSPSEKAASEGEPQLPPISSQVAGHGGDPASPSEDYSRPSEEQRQRYRSIMSDLKKANPENVWQNTAKRYVRNKLNKPEGAQLDATEFEALLAHLQTKLNMELAPFS